MTRKTVLVRGGGGFIGRNLVPELLSKNYNVKILDNFDPQIHGAGKRIKEHWFKKAEVIRGDIRNAGKAVEALKGVHVLIHLAAVTGTGQSMYDVSRYYSVNVTGTSVLMEAVIRARYSKLEKIILASSRAIYGEGKYQCKRHGTVYPEQRPLRDLRRGRFDSACPSCHVLVVPRPTDEESQIKPVSFYGQTKWMQERMLFLFGKICDLPVIALRFQNVFGPGQSLLNPYTGILVIFANLARWNKPINVFEDGKESRNFVYIQDVVNAVLLGLKGSIDQSGSFNIGSDQTITIEQAACEIIRILGSKSKVTISGDFRVGDIRHAIASLGKAKKALRYKPVWNFDSGLRRLLEWQEQEDTVLKGYESSIGEMKAVGLLGRSHQDRKMKR